MQGFDYEVGLFTIIIGLAVVDIATSFHKLMRLRRTLTWDPLVLLDALYALFLAITMWFKIWGVRTFPVLGDYLFCLTLCAEYLLLFLIAAASLPDDPHEGIDLRRFYDDNRRYLWGLIVLYQFSNIGHAIYFETHGLEPTWMHTVTSFALPLALSMLLFASRSRTVHYVVVSLLLVTLVADRVGNVIN